MPEYKRLRLLAAAFLFACLLDPFAIAQSVVPSHIQLLQETLARGGTLADAADKVGHLNLGSGQGTICWGPFTLSDLIQGSQVIVVGKIDRRFSKVSGPWDIETRYALRIDQTLKGRVANPLVFSAGGGRVRFPSGSSAEMGTTSYLRLIPGSRFLIFLRKVDDKTLRVYGEPNGIFEIQSGKIRSLALHDPSEESLHQLTGETEEAVVRRIRWLTTPEKIDWLQAAKSRQSPLGKAWLITIGALGVSLLSLFGAVHYRRHP